MESRIDTWEDAQIGSKPCYIEHDIQDAITTSQSNYSIELGVVVYRRSRTYSLYSPIRIVILKTQYRGDSQKN